MGKKITAVSMESIMQEEEEEDIVDVLFEEEQEEANDLSCWEFVNPSDADSDTDSLHSLENGFVSWYSPSPTSSPPKPDPETQTQLPITLQDQNLLNQVRFCDEQQFNSHQYDSDVVDEDDGDDDDDGDEYGLDDELVPWHVTGKLGRQRMRKLGKRVFAKMSNSKRNPYLHVMRGCVHGKHGLGIKA